MKMQTRFKANLYEETVVKYLVNNPLQAAGMSADNVRG